MGSRVDSKNKTEKQENIDSRYVEYLRNKDSIPLVLYKIIDSGTKHKEYLNPYEEAVEPQSKIKPKT